jgi:hypothetical protein
VKEGNVFTHNQVISEAKHKYGFWDGSDLVF